MLVPIPSTVAAEVRRLIDEGHSTGRIAKLGRRPLHDPRGDPVLELDLTARLMVIRAAPQNL